MKKPTKKSSMLTMNIYLYNRKQIITNTYAYNIKKRFLIIPPHSASSSPTILNPAENLKKYLLSQQK
jgi:hypothetical protein